MSAAGDTVRVTVQDGVPDRADWPPHPPTTATGDALTALVLETFRLNGRLQQAGQRLADAGGMTVAWWQVLAGVLDGPRTHAEIGRQMGVSRQAVRRVADLLVEHGLAEYRPNPAHRRASLLACTEAGYWAVRRTSIAQVPWAERIGAAVGADDLERARAVMAQLVEALDADAHDEQAGGS